MFFQTFQEMIQTTMISTVFVFLLAERTTKFVFAFASLLDIFKLHYMIRNLLFKQRFFILGVE